MRQVFEGFVFAHCAMFSNIYAYKMCRDDYTLVFKLSIMPGDYSRSFLWIEVTKGCGSHRESGVTIQQAISNAIGNGFKVCEFDTFKEFAQWATTNA